MLKFKEDFYPHVEKYFNLTCKLARRIVLQTSFHLQFQGHINNREDAHMCHEHNQLLQCTRHNSGLYNQDDNFSNKKCILYFSVLFKYSNIISNSYNIKFYLRAMTWKYTLAIYTTLTTCCERGKICSI